jgi:predicted metal-binding membrane protein
MQDAVPAGRHAAIDRGRRVLVATLLVLAALAWAATIALARSPAAMSVMPGQPAPVAAALFAGMWLVMMAAMMLPAIVPVVLLFRTVQRQRGARGGPVVPVAVFVSGYLAVWLLAGLGADLAYTVAHALGARVPFGPNAAPYLGGAILVLAGLYQFTPLKNVCLKHCRSPLHFVMHGWRDGRMGAVRMGATHGLFCLGCCWGIMAVLFVVGLMNLGWMAALSLLIMAEKVAPRGVAIGRVVGGLFVALGMLMALQPGLFAAAGLVSSETMAMGSMPAPAASHVAYRAVAGPYALTLTIGPAETMLTPAEARRIPAGTGEVALEGAMASAMPMSGMQRHLELRAVDRAMGMAVTGAHVTIRVLGPGAPQSVLRLARMYDAKEGMKDLHYGANVRMDQGAYTVRVGLSNHAATLHVRVP